MPTFQENITSPTSRNSITILNTYEFVCEKHQEHLRYYREHILWLFHIHMKLSVTNIQNIPNPAESLSDDCSMCMALSLCVVTTPPANFAYWSAAVLKESGIILTCNIHTTQCHVLRGTYTKHKSAIKYQKNLYIYNAASSWQHANQHGLC
jgi:hypothetical protein